LVTLALGMARRALRPIGSVLDIEQSDFPELGGLSYDFNGRPPPRDL
jgi:hypothetical protein